MKTITTTLLILLGLISHSQVGVIELLETSSNFGFKVPPMLPYMNNYVQDITNELWFTSLEIDPETMTSYQSDHTPDSVWFITYGDTILLNDQFYLELELLNSDSTVSEPGYALPCRDTHYFSIISQYTFFEEKYLFQTDSIVVFAGLLYPQGFPLCDKDVNDMDPVFIYNMVQDDLYSYLIQGSLLGDHNSDYKVDVLDLLWVSENWGL